MNSTRDHRFTVLVDDDELDLLHRVATKMERSKGDTVRVLVREAAARYGIKPVPEKPAKQAPV